MLLKQGQNKAGGGACQVEARVTFQRTPLKFRMSRTLQVIFHETLKPRKVV